MEPTHMEHLLCAKCWVQGFRYYLTDSSHQLYGIGAMIITSNLEVRILSLREVKYFSQGPPVG